MMAEQTVHMLTTVDNPWNPFTHFSEWNAWDQAAGYHTLAYLGRVTLWSVELSDADQSLAIEHAIDEILEHNVSGMHRKVPMPS
jgi:hypothetical protein